MSTKMIIFSMVLSILAVSVYSYDPDDKLIEKVLPSKDTRFEAFYPRKAYGVPNGSARPPHGHGTFYSHRNPALIDTPNSPAYGFRFDGKRRFNFDDE